MTHDTENTSADIAWMRQLAEEGSRAPMRGASFLLAAGLIYGLASLGHWAIATDLIAVAPSVLNAVWGIATLAFLAFVVVASLRLRARSGVVTAANRASRAAWTGVGWGVFVLIGSMAVVSSRADETAALVLLSLLPSVIMVFYGMAWAVTAAMLKSRPLWVLAVASFAAAPLLAYLAGQTAQYLAYAAALFLLVGLPGFLLMRQAGRA